MKKKPTNYQAEIIKSALISAQNEAIRNLKDSKPENKHIWQADISKYGDVLFELFGI